MRDRDSVAAIVAGDPAGLAAAYDSYAASLHAYCRTLLGEPADAADSVQDTFVIAAAKLGALRDPDRLRPWLYAVARNECHRRLRGRARQADLAEAGEVTDDDADVGARAEREELRGLVLDAIGGLNPGDREVIELNLRHDLGERSSWPRALEASACAWLAGTPSASARSAPVPQARARRPRRRPSRPRSPPRRRPPRRHPPRPGRLPARPPHPGARRAAPVPARARARAPRRRLLPARSASRPPW